MSLEDGKKSFVIKETIHAIYDLVNSNGSLTLSTAMYSHGLEFKSMAIDPPLEFYKSGADSKNLLERISSRYLISEDHARRFFRACYWYLTTCEYKPIMSANATFSYPVSDEDKYEKTVLRITFSFRSDLNDEEILDISNKINKKYGDYLN